MVTQAEQKLESDQTLVLRPITFNRTRPVMSGTLLEMTGHWGCCVQLVHVAASGRHMTIEIRHSVFEAGDTWLSSSDRTLRSSVWSI